MTGLPAAVARHGCAWSVRGTGQWVAVSATHPLSCHLLFFFGSPQRSLFPGSGGIGGDKPGTQSWPVRPWHSPGPG